jgi:hypothetical protein
MTAQRSPAQVTVRAAAGKTFHDSSEVLHAVIGSFQTVTAEHSVAALRVVRHQRGLSW